MNILSDREKKIIDLRFGLNNEKGEELTQKEVADLHIVKDLQMKHSLYKTNTVKFFHDYTILNEILMYLRRSAKTKMEVSIDEPLNVDWDGNELLLSDILGTTLFIQDKYR
mgnify:CR=1 FL=1